LDIVGKCVERRCKLLGLDEPEKIDVKATVLAASIQLQETIQTNGEYIEWRRRAALGPGCYAVPGIVCDASEQRQLEDGITLDVVGHVVGANGNGKATAAQSTVSGSNHRNGSNGNGKAH
jgi:hypothetical protein